MSDLIKYHIGSNVANVSFEDFNNINIHELRRLPNTNLVYYNYIYILFNNNTIVYIGRSKSNPNNRIEFHKQDKKVFDEYSIIKLGEHHSEVELNGIESDLIMKHQPIYNKSFPISIYWAKRQGLHKLLGCNYKSLIEMLKEININDYYFSFRENSYINVIDLKKALNL